MLKNLLFFNFGWHLCGFRHYRLWVQLLFLVLVTTSCQVVKIYSPGPGVTLASEYEQLQYRIKKKDVFVLWGLIPIENRSTAETIALYKFTKVRVFNKFNFTDYLVRSLTYGLVYTRTTVVEGSVQPSPDQILTPL